MQQIKKLYDIEDRARDLSIDERLALRQAESRSIVNEIEAIVQQRKIESHAAAHRKRVRRQKRRAQLARQ